jgi:hypothetical protein
VVHPLLFYAQLEQRPDEHIRHQFGTLFNSQYAFDPFDPFNDFDNFNDHQRTAGDSC